MPHGGGGALGLSAQGSHNIGLLEPRTGRSSSRDSRHTLRKSQRHNLRISVWIVRVNRGLVGT